MSRFTLIIFAFLGSLPCVLNAQKKLGPPIMLNNPSFEGTPYTGLIGGGGPMGWNNCGKADESAPDIQPGAFEVTKAPNHGHTYLGMVVRDNDTWESVSQRLTRPLELGKTYEMTIDLANSNRYISLSRKLSTKVNYSAPVKVRFYGGNETCAKQELLYETPAVINERWLTYYLRFQPKKSNYLYLIIEAYYNTPIVFPYNGNVLVDNASPIQEIDERPLSAAAKTKPKPTPTHDPTPTRTTTTVSPGVAARSTPERGSGDTAVKLASPTVPPVLIDRTKIAKGDIIRLHNILFEVDRYDIKESSLPTLESVYNFLRDNPDVSVEIGGHTNNRPADDFALRLSTNRAKAVADWLVAKGIASARIQSKGYGKKFPISTSATEEGMRKNQRVEIKILSLSK